MHESFSSGCLFDMGEGIRGKRRGESCFPRGFWRTMRRDWGWAPGSWTQTIFWTGRSSCSRHREKPRGDSVLRHTCCCFSHLWGPAMEKQQILDPDLMLCQILRRDLFYGCLRPGLFLCSGFVFCSREPPLASKLILTDWPRGQTPRFTPRLYWATRLHATFQCGSSLAVYKAVSFLARAVFALTQESVTTDV